MDLENENGRKDDEGQVGEKSIGTRLLRVIIPRWHNVRFLETQICCIFVFPLSFNIVCN